jgi:arginase family enzyme
MTTENKRSKTHGLIHVEPFGENELDITDYFTKSKMDYKICRDMYKPHKNTLAIYDLLRQIMIDKKNQIITPIITLSPDPSISASTVGGSAEKHMTFNTDDKGNTIPGTNLHVLYFDSSLDISSEPYDTYDAYKNAVLSNIAGLRHDSFSMCRVVVPPEQITIIGIDDDLIDEAQSNILINENLDVYTDEQIKRKGIKTIMGIVLDKYKYLNVHVVIDLSCIQKRYAPSVLREEHNKPGKKSNTGFDLAQLQQILDCLNELEYLNGVDIVGYNFGDRKDKDKHSMANMITVKTIMMIVTSLIDLEYKSINMFNEESKFLIWRRLDDPDPIGWYIMRNIELKQREEIIKAVGDKIESLPIIDDDGNDFYALVAVTTVKEQKEKCYYVASNLNETCLTPTEKSSMIYELLNTPTYQAIQEKYLQSHVNGNNEDEDEDCDESEETEEKEC